ncbi:MAG: hypothetical protein K2K55_07865 [Duncaniella sp.]|nr:hypothetical protein [Duncaniella sp.]
MFGQEVEYDFYRCTGWLLISGGLGGYLAPEQMLKEALLYPCDVEHENFGRMLSGIVPFMNDEVQRFFRKQESMNINHQAYLRMLAGTRDRIDEFLMIINERTEDFRDSFLTSVELL